MFSKWIESDSFPGTRVLVRPFNGPQVLDLQVQGITGASVYPAVRFAVQDWEHAPLLGEDKFVEKYDPSMIDQLRPDFAIWIVTEVTSLLSSLSESERKNS